MIDQQAQQDWSRGGIITELSDGFVLLWRGETYACETAESLGQKLTRLASRPLPTVVEMPERPTPEPFTGEPITFEPPLTWTQVWPMEPELSPAQQVDLERENLLKLAGALVAREINGDRFEKLVKVYCPNATGDDMDAALERAEQEAYGPPVSGGESDDSPGVSEENFAEELDETPIPFEPDHPKREETVAADYCHCEIGPCPEFHEPGQVLCADCGQGEHWHDKNREGVRS